MARAGLTPDIVEEAAAAIADREGYDSVSVSAVARSLGVQPASLYGHVSGKAALLGRLHRRALDELGVLIADATVGASGRDALSGYFDAHRTFAASRPGLWEALQRSADPETVASSSADRVSRLTLAVLRGYGLSGAAAVHAARLVGATITGFISLEEAGSIRHREPQTTDSWEAAIDALDRALRTWPGGGRSGDVRGIAGSHQPAE